MLSRQWFFGSSAPGAVLLVRLLVGWVFLSEGIQKFLVPAALGVGRFEKNRHPGSRVLRAICRRG
jgi:putative oxidoreductase